MPRLTIRAVATIGIGMGKNTLHMIDLDSRGVIVLREKASPGRISSRLANLPPCLIGIEAGWRRTTSLANSPRRATM
jgi:transposase